MSGTQLAKPQMRSLLTKQIARHLTIVFGLMATTLVVQKEFVFNERKARYAEFYKNLDAEAEYKRMVDAGHMTKTS